MAVTLNNEDNLFVAVDTDTIFGLDGDDTLLSADAGGSLLFGDAGSDSLVGNGEGDTLDGGDGDDTINSEDDEVSVSGGSSNDSIQVNGDRVSVSGGEGQDVINYSGENAFVLGDVGNDFIRLAEGERNAVAGFEGNDTVVSSGNRDTINGGIGNDGIVLTSDVSRDAGGFNFLGGRDNDFISLNRLGGTNPIETSENVLNGNIGNDTLIGVGENSSLFGGSDNDSLVGTGDEMQLWGDLGNDTIQGFGSNMTLQGGNTEGAGNGDDYLRANVVEGGTDITVSFSEAEGTVGFGENIAPGLGDNAVIGENALVGGAGNDTIVSAHTGSEQGSDSLFGEGGDDFLAGVGNVQISGGAGNDTLVYNGNVEAAGTGDSEGTSTEEEFELGPQTDEVIVTLDGGAGNDSISLENINTDNLDLDLRLGNGADILRVGSGVDNINASGESGNDTLIGGTGNDTFIGGDGDDFLRGGEGANVLRGFAGNDWVSGGDATATGTGVDDTVRGGAGSDTLVGGAGNDVLIGGPDDDQFLFGEVEFGTGDVAALNPGINNDQLGVDTITDYGPQDQIALSEDVFDVQTDNFGGQTFLAQGEFARFDATEVDTSLGTTNSSFESFGDNNLDDRPESLIFVTDDNKGVLFHNASSGNGDVDPFAVIQNPDAVDRGDFIVF